MKKWSLIIRLCKIVALTIIAIFLWNSNGELNHKLALYENATMVKAGPVLNGAPFQICTDDTHCIGLISELKEDFSGINSFHLLIIVLTIIITLAELPEIVRDIKQKPERENDTHR